jgi:hypothetical protein
MRWCGVVTLSQIEQNSPITANAQAWDFNHLACCSIAEIGLIVLNVTTPSQLSHVCRQLAGDDQLCQVVVEKIWRSCRPWSCGNWSPQVQPPPQTLNTRSSGSFAGSTRSRNSVCAKFPDFASGTIPSHKWIQTCLWEQKSYPFAPSPWHRRSDDPTPSFVRRICGAS